MSDQILQKALLLHQKGEFDAAKDLYEQILKFEPNHFDALQLVGAIGVQTSDYDLAKACLLKALCINPNHASAQNNLGLAEQATGNSDQAYIRFSESIRINPNFAQAYYNRALLNSTLGKTKEALEDINQALKLNPLYSEAFNNRGLIYQALNQPQDAVLDFERAIEINEVFSEAHFNRANSLIHLNRIDDAISSYSSALLINPNYIEAYNNLGLTLQKRRNFDDALSCFEKALELKADFVDALFNKANILQEVGLADKAVDYYKRAISLSPEFADAYCNLGTAQHELQQFDFALSSYNKSISLKPDGYDALFNKSLLQLRLGNYLDGWALYEYRWKTKSLENAYRSFHQPAWDGTKDLSNKTIIVWAEQGLGDTIQFCRYIKYLAQLSAKVILEVPESLVSILSDIQGASSVLRIGEFRGSYDYHCPLLSLPLLLKTSIQTIPSQVPYIKVDPKKEEYWRGKLFEYPNPKVGLVWSSGFRENQPEVWGYAQKKNIPLELLQKIVTPQFSWFSLQKGKLAESQLTMLKKTSINQLNIHDFASELNDFSDTAALMQNLDLIISVDTSVAHMAGAMSKPLLLLSQFNTDWRWVDGQREHWYPSATLINQKQPGNWESVLDQLAIVLNNKSRNSSLN